MFLVVFASAFGLLIRLPLYGVISGDMRDCLLPWFSQISENGALRGLKQQVGDYNVFYQGLIALLTYLPFDPMALIKSLSVAFDYLLALCVGKFAYDMTDEASGARRSNFAFAYALTLLLPTVFLNSAAWGQCDSIYAAFCVLCIDLLLPRGKNSPPPEKFCWRSSRWALPLP